MILTFVESSSASFIVAGTAVVGGSVESVTLVGPWLTAEGGDIDLVGVDWVRGDDSVLWAGGEVYVEVGRRWETASS